MLELRSIFSYEPARISVPGRYRAEWPCFNLGIQRYETIITYIGYEKPRLP
jgi:hypothetical protein